MTSKVHKPVNYSREFRRSTSTKDKKSTSSNSPEVEEILTFVKGDLLQCIDEGVKRYKNLMDDLLSTNHPFKTSQLLDYHKQNLQVILDSLDESYKEVMNLSNPNTTIRIQAMILLAKGRIEILINAQFNEIYQRKYEIQIETIVKMVKSFTNEAESEYDKSCENFELIPTDPKGIKQFHDQCVEKATKYFETMLRKNDIKNGFFWKYELLQRLGERLEDMLTECLVPAPEFSKPVDKEMTTPMTTDQLNPELADTQSKVLAVSPNLEAPKKDLLDDDPLNAKRSNSSKEDPLLTGREGVKFQRKSSDDQNFNSSTTVPQSIAAKQTQPKTTAQTANDLLSIQRYNPSSKDSVLQTGESKLQKTETLRPKISEEPPINSPTTVAQPLAANQKQPQITAKVDTEQVSSTKEHAEKVSTVSGKAQPVKETAVGGKHEIPTKAPIESNAALKAKETNQVQPVKRSTEAKKSTEIQGSSKKSHSVASHQLRKEQIANDSLKVQTNKSSNDDLISQQEEREKEKAVTTHPKPSKVHRNNSSTTVSEPVAANQAQRKATAKANTQLDTSTNKHIKKVLTATSKPEDLKEPSVPSVKTVRVDGNEEISTQAHIESTTSTSSKREETKLMQPKDESMDGKISTEIFVSQNKSYNQQAAPITTKKMENESAFGQQHPPSDLTHDSPQTGNVAATQQPKTFNQKASEKVSAASSLEVYNQRLSKKSSATTQKNTALSSVGTQPQTSEENSNRVLPAFKVDISEETGESHESSPTITGKKVPTELTNTYSSETTEPTMKRSYVPGTACQNSSTGATNAEASEAENLVAVTDRALSNAPQQCSEPIECSKNKYSIAESKSSVQISYANVSTRPVPTSIEIVSSPPASGMQNSERRIIDVGAYFDANSFTIGLYLPAVPNSSQSPEYFTELISVPPTIYFSEKKVLVGEETKCYSKKHDYKYFNIFKLVTSSATTDPKHLFFNHTKFTLCKHEIIAVFFHEVLTRVQCERNVRIRKIVITIPFTPTSSVKETIQNSAHIAGWEGIKILSTLPAMALALPTTLTYFQGMQENDSDTSKKYIFALDYNKKTFVMGLIKLSSSSMCVINSYGSDNIQECQGEPYLQRHSHLHDGDQSWKIYVTNIYEQAINYVLNNVKTSKVKFVATGYSKSQIIENMVLEMLKTKLTVQSAAMNENPLKGASLLASSISSPPSRSAFLPEILVQDSSRAFLRFISPIKTIKYDFRNTPYVDEAVIYIQFSVTVGDNHRPTDVVIRLHEDYGTEQGIFEACRYRLSLVNNCHIESEECNANMSGKEDVQVRIECSMDADGVLLLHAESSSDIPVELETVRMDYLTCLYACQNPKSPDYEKLKAFYAKQHKPRKPTNNSETVFMVKPD